MNTIQEELKKLNDKWKGKDVRVISTIDHPHAGECGTIEAVEMTGLGKPGIKIKGEIDGFYVFSSKHLQLLK